MISKKIAFGLVGVVIIVGGLFYLRGQNTSTPSSEKTITPEIAPTPLVESAPIQAKKDVGEMTDEEIFAEAGYVPFDILEKKVFSSPRSEWMEHGGKGYSFALPPIYEQDPSHTWYVPGEFRDVGSASFLKIQATTSPKSPYHPELFEDYNKSDVSKKAYLVPRTSSIVCDGRTFTEERMENNGAEMEAIHIRRFVFEKAENLSILTFQYSTAGYGDAGKQKIFAEQNEKLKCDILSTFEIKP